VEWLNWAVRDQGLDFGIISDEPSEKHSGFPISGEIVSVDPRRNNGFRLGLGYQFPSCWDVVWTYTYFAANDSESLVAPVGGVLRTPRGHPRWGKLADTADAFASFKYDVNDIEFGRWFQLTDTAALRLFGGFRWLIVNEDFTVHYNGQDYLNGVVDNPMTMDAYGIHIGGEGRWNLPRGFSIFARGASSVLVGNFHTRLRQTDDGTAWLGVGPVLVDVSRNFTQAVPGLDTALGLAWRRGTWRSAPATS
jgi:hypothetical protein